MFAERLLTVIHRRTASGEAARVALRSAAEGPDRLTFDAPSEGMVLGANGRGVYAGRSMTDSNAAGRPLEQSGGCAAVSRLRPAAVAAVSRLRPAAVGAISRLRPAAVADNVN